MFKFFGIGRLVADPELQDIQTNDNTKSTHVARFTVAVNEFRKVHDEKIVHTSFLDCEAWDSGAKTIAETYKKGDMIAVTGRVRQNKWKTEEGHNRSRVIFRVEEFAPGKKAARNEESFNEQDPE